MKSQLVTVFGNYDSRGGTIAIKIPDTKPESIKQSFDRYNKMYGWDGTHTHNAGAGRQVDQAIYTLIHGENSPSTEHFLYIAELHNPPEFENAEIEEYQNEDSYMIVCIDSSTEPEGDEDLDTKIKLTSQSPVQLEWVEVPNGVIDELQDIVDYTNDPDELVEAKEQLHQVLSEYVQHINKEMVEHPHWDDDAYGFVLCSIEEETQSTITP